MKKNKGGIFQMTLEKERVEFLEKKCCQLRIDLVELLHSIQTGHPGGSLSAVEILTTLYLEKLNLDGSNQEDKFVLSKGHAAPILYLLLAEKGIIPKEELKTLRQLNSRLQGHPCANKTPGIEVSGGPLGLGISAAVGMALAAKQDKKDSYIYVLLGDGEIQEGIVWEALMAANKYNLNNLIAIVDNNGVQLDGTVDEVMPLGDISKKWDSFGWNVIKANGHNITSLSDSFDKAKDEKEKPSVIIANTVKGNGISFMENKNTWHGKAIEKDHCSKALAELEVVLNG
jgi:transketolase